MTADEKYMLIAMHLAQKGAGVVNPNPMVGAVVVKNGRIVGKGYHEYFGGAHAELNALTMAGRSAKGATLYVTLEPCNHEGKTPPCAPLVAGKGIARVVVGLKDPNPGVNGNGAGYLMDHGVTVVTGILEEKLKRQNEIFLKYITTKRPFCVLKTAISLDGKTATVTGESKWISGVQSRADVHKLRKDIAAIMVGADTIIHDDPLLNVRNQGKHVKNPLKVIVDSSGRIALTAKALENDPQLCIVAMTERTDPKRRRDLERLGVQVLICPEMEGHVDLRYMATALGAMGIDSMLLESGGTLAFAALDAQIVDKVRVYISPRIFGGVTAPGMVGGKGIESLDKAFRLENISWQKSGEDMRMEGTIVKNEK